ncbi:hypothetical protein HC251_15250 [Iamia sp. SCSIO 61187]|uniref:DUF5522 domain-containing protein n=1 Tax=Iamia sp. SCSIO 61187 TaxID=2722752 RepID=UPI001C63553B|nr:DUF5522 domain-containing protein [Iamia sp. SCSIO 61187]QYG93646.1 hypothetical protein HC251_15250 [Iamia sp. SCSIO 61187]
MTPSPGDDAPLRDGWRDTPAPSRLPLDHPLRAEILAAHAAALEAGHGMYVDPVSGYMAMTADTLALRGWCCGTGCRHCPWAEA